MPDITTVTTYEHPDLDGYACALAYAELLNTGGTSARPYIDGRPHDEVMYMLGLHDLQLPSSDKPTEGPVILVDSSDLLGLPAAFRPEQVTEIIDHRAVHQAELFPQAKAQIEKVGAAATLIAERFQKQGLVPSRQSALLLYAAIASNTLAFKASVTTDRDIKIAEWLAGPLKLEPEFINDLFLAKSDLEGDKLYARIGSDFARFQFGDTSIGIAQIEMIGVEKLVSQRSEEILVVVQQLGKEFDLDHTFISLIDIQAELNLFLSMSAKTRQLVGSALGLSFENNPLRRPGLLMRKELVPLLKNKLAS